MSADVSKFNGCYIQVADSHPSGHDDDQIMAMALDLWRSRYDRKFAYLHSWKILKEQPKWQQFAKKEDRSSKRTKNSVSGTYTSSSSNPDASENDNVVEVMDVRPPGQKAAKAAARGKGKAKNKKTNPEAMETWSKFEELQAKKMSLYEERIRVQDFELLCKDTSNLDENARKNHESVCQYIRTKYGV